MARRGTGGDKARPYHCCERQHEVFHWQIHSVLAVSELLGERAGGIEDDVDLAPLLHNAVEVLIDGRVIEGVNYSRLRPAPVFADLLSYCFQIGLCATRQENFCTFCRELLCYSGADGTAGPNTTACLPCRISELFIAISVYYVPCFLTGRRSNSAITDIIS
jgi:hypothetical protein